MSEPIRIHGMREGDARFFGPTAEIMPTSAGRFTIFRFFNNGTGLPAHKEPFAGTDSVFEAVEILQREGCDCAQFVYTHKDSVRAIWMRLSTWLACERAVAAAVAMDARPADSTHGRAAA